MIKEAYCSFEVARLLKEKGFNEAIRCWYDNFQDFHEEGVRMSNTDCLPPTIMCPTHQMAMAWLREVHNIDICAFPYQADYILYSYNVKIYKDKEIYLTITDSKTYEESVEAALKYSLKNLI